jgi:hypothetical protein
MAPALGADLGSAVVSHRHEAVKSATALGRDIAVQPLLHRNVELGIRDIEAWLRGSTTRWRTSRRLRSALAGVAVGTQRGAAVSGSQSMRCTNVYDAGRFKDAREVFEQAALAERLQRVFSCCWTEWSDDHDNDLP